jgi:predicted HD superfamily hydrolase involved in NAD metabolism
MGVQINELFIQRIDESLRVQIKKSRYRHTQGVLESATELAVRYGADQQKTAVAALLHDYAKDYSREELLLLAARYQLDIDDLMKHAFQLLHGIVAAAIARHEYQIDDPDILLAIENHTTGRRDMGIIEKIIYLSDFIEPGRHYPGVEELRALAKEDLDKAVFKALNNTMIYVLTTGKLLHPKTLEARNQMLLLDATLKNQK